MKRLVVCFLILFSCGKEKMKMDKFLDFKNDTIFSKGNQIVFFKPSDRFYQKELSSFEGIEEVDSDFNYYASEVCNDIKNILDFPLKAIISESRFLGVIDFKSDTTFIDRYKDSLHYGTLLNFKNKKYKIDEGVFTDEDFIEDFLPLKHGKTKESKEAIDLGIKLDVWIYGEDKDYDTIINSSDLNSYIDLDFKYKKFDKNISKNKVIFSQDSSTLIITKSTFNKNRYKISSTQDLGITLNGQRLEGIDEFLPSEIISFISVRLNNQDVIIEKRDYENLAEPNFAYSDVYQLDKNTLLLKMQNSDGAGGYAFYFIINNKGESEKYIVYP